jgi:hypothetical protein
LHSRKSERALRSFPYVLGPDGTPLTPGDLPRGRVVRWLPRQKAVVVIAVNSGLCSLATACERYALSKEEFQAWESAYAALGLRGLRTTHRRVGERCTNAIPFQARTVPAQVALRADAQVALGAGDAALRVPEAA